MDTGNKESNRVLEFQPTTNPLTDVEAAIKKLKGDGVQIAAIPEFFAQNEQFQVRKAAFENISGRGTLICCDQRQVWEQLIDFLKKDSGSYELFPTALSIYLRNSCGATKFESFRFALGLLSKADSNVGMCTQIIKTVFGSIKQDDYHGGGDYCSSACRSVAERMSRRHARVGWFDILPELRLFIRTVIDKLSDRLKDDIKYLAKNNDPWNIDDHSIIIDFENVRRALELIIAQKKFSPGFLPELEKLSGQYRNLRGLLKKHKPNNSSEGLSLLFMIAHQRGILSESISILKEAKSGM